MVVSEDRIPELLRERYSAQGAVPLFLSRDDEAFLVSKNCQVFRAPLLHVQDSGVIRHHSARLAESLMRVYRRLESGQKK